MFSLSVTGFKFVSGGFRNCDYAIAYSNLGDVYRRLAEKAYGDAVRRNPGDAHAAAGLRQVGAAAPASAPAPSVAPASAPAAAPASRKASGAR